MTRDSGTYKTITQLCLIPRHNTRRDRNYLIIAPAQRRTSQNSRLLVTFSNDNTLTK